MCFVRFCSHLSVSLIHIHYNNIFALVVFISLFHSLFILSELKLMKELISMNVFNNNVRSFFFYYFFVYFFFFTNFVSYIAILKNNLKCCLMRLLVDVVSRERKKKKKPLTNGHTYINTILENSLINSDKTAIQANEINCFWFNSFRILIRCLKNLSYSIWSDVYFDFAVKHRYRVNGGDFPCCMCCVRRAYLV